MTDVELMQAGKIHYWSNEEIDAMNFRAKKLIYEYNNTKPHEGDKRNDILIMYGIVTDALDNYVKIYRYYKNQEASKLNKKEFLYDVKCSKSLTDEIERLHAKGICYRTGNSYTKAKVKDDNLPFGGELSGHVYFNDKWPCFDSGLYAGLRLVEILSKSDKSVSELLKGINNYYSTEELKFPSSDEKKFEVVCKIKEYVMSKKYDVNDIDGVRVTFDYGWALVRCSNTGPNITARFEADTKENLEKLQNEFTLQINKYNV